MQADTASAYLLWVWVGYTISAMGSGTFRSLVQACDCLGLLRALIFPVLPTTALVLHLGELKMQPRAAAALHSSSGR